MKAAVIRKFGGPEVLEVLDVPQPEPQRGEVLVRVHASGLNRADLLQRQGKYPPPAGAPQEIPGMEFAGEVAKCGDAATAWKPGQRVFGVVAAGAHAEYLVTHERALAEAPRELAWAQAGGIPEAFITAHDAMWKQAELRLGESVLVHAVGSGVGLAAVQLARTMNANVYGTSRTQSKLDEAAKYGMNGGLLLKNDLAALSDFAKKVTGGKGFDVVLDLAGGPYVGASVAAMAAKGRILLIGTVAGAETQLNLGQMLFKRVRMVGTVLRARPLEEKIQVTQAFAKEVVPLFASGVLKVVIDAEFPLDNIQDAHRRLESNETFGKVVLTM